MTFKEKHINPPDCTSNNNWNFEFFQMSMWLESDVCLFVFALFYLSLVPLPRSY